MKRDLKAELDRLDEAMEEFFGCDNAEPEKKEGCDCVEGCNGTHCAVCKCKK